MKEQERTEQKKCRRSVSAAAVSACCLHGLLYLQFHQSRARDTATNVERPLSLTGQTEGLKMRPILFLLNASPVKIPASHCIYVYWTDKGGIQSIEKIYISEFFS